jgi:hypothetical protein
MEAGIWSSSELVLLIRGHMPYDFSRPALRCRVTEERIIVLPLLANVCNSQFRRLPRHLYISDYCSTPRLMDYQVGIEQLPTRMADMRFLLDFPSTVFTVTSNFTYNFIVPTYPLPVRDRARL